MVGAAPFGLQPCGQCDFNGFAEQNFLELIPAAGWIKMWWITSWPVPWFLPLDSPARCWRGSSRPRRSSPRTPLRLPSCVPKASFWRIRRAVPQPHSPQNR